MRRARLGAVLALATVLVLLLAFGRFPQAPLKSLIEERASAALGGSVRIGHLKLVPVALSAEIEDLEVEAPSFHLSVPKARAVLYRASLSGGVLAFESLRLERPTLTLLPVAARKAPVRAPPRLWIDHFDVVDASVERPASAGFSARGLSAHGAIGSGELWLRATGIAWQQPTPAAGVFEARLRIDMDLSAELETGHFEAPGLSIDASGRLGPLTAPTPDLKLTARVQFPELLRLLPEPVADIRGQLGIEARVRGTTAAPSVEATAQSAGLRLAGWKLNSASASGSYRVGAADLEFTARALDGKLSGKASLRGEDLQANLDADSVVLPDVGRVSVKGNARGGLNRRLAVTANATLDGARDGLTYHVSAEGAGGIAMPHLVLDGAWSAQAAAEAPGLRGLDARADGTARGSWPLTVAGSLVGSARLDRADAPVRIPLSGLFRSEGSSMQAELTASPGAGTLSISMGLEGRSAPHLTAAGRRLDLALLDPRAGGQLSVDLDLRDPLGQVTGSGRGELAGASWAGASFGEAHVSLAAEQGRVVAQWAAPALGLTGEARRASARTKTIDGELSFDATPLQPFAAAAGHAGLAGQLSASAEFSLPMARLGAADVKARVLAFDATEGRYATRAAGPFSLTLHEGTLGVEELRIEAHGAALAVSGHLGLEASCPMALQAKLTAELAQLPLPEGVAAAGRVEAELAFSGSPQRPEAVGEITGSALRFEAPSTPVVSVPVLKAELAGRTLVLSSATASFAEGTLSAGGRVPLAAVWPAARAHRRSLAKDEEARLELHWQGVRVPELLRRLKPKLAETLTASASGDALVEGGLASPGEARATVALRLEQVRANDLAFEVSPLELELHGGRVSSPGLTIGGAGGSLSLSGSADLERRQLDVLGKGRLDLRALSPFLADTSATGAADVDLSIVGPLAALLARGRIDIAGAALRSRAFPHALTALNGALVFEGDEARIETLTALLAGGTMSATGGARLAGAEGPSLDVKLEGRELSLRYPEGLRTRVDTDLSLTGTPGALHLGGELRAERGLYDIGAALRQSLKAEPIAKTVSPFLRGIALDVAALTRNPVLVRHDLVRLEASGQLSVRGDMETPAPFGRVEVLGGGKLELLGHEFSVESGALSYSGTWNPDLSLRMSATVRDVEYQRDYSIRITASGSLENPQLAFSSDPSESEAHLLSLLATGRFDANGVQSVGRMAGNQLAILMTSRLTGGLARGLGLDRVSLQPELLSREKEPGARFTFEKQLSDRLRAIQSYSLNDPEATFTKLELAVPKEVTLIAQRDDDGSLSAGAGQRLRFGGPSGPRQTSQEKAVRLGEVLLEGAPPREERALRGTLKVKQGKRATASRVQDDAERLRRLLVEHGFIEAEVGGKLEQTTAIFTVRAGPRFTTQVEGMASPPDLSKALKAALYEDEALEAGRAALLEALHRRGYLRARVTAAASSHEENRVLRFQVEPAGRASDVRLDFPGGKALGSKPLAKAAGGPAAFLSDPELALERIRAAYAAMFHLGVQLGPVVVDEAGGSLHIVVPVSEGVPARVASLRVEGSSLAAGEAEKAARLPAGEPYVEAAVVAAATRLRDKYLSLGYPAVRVVPEVKLAAPDIGVILRVAEGERLTLGRIEIRGASRTRLSLVRGRLQLKPGAPLDLRALTGAERRLMELGVFTRVSITYTREDPSVVTVEVTEEASLAARYEVRYNDKDGATGDVDAEFGNLFGRGLALGGRYRLGSDIEDERASLQLPALFGGDLVASVFRTSEDTPADPADPGLGTNNSLERGFQVQQKMRLPRSVDLLFGYRFRRITETSPFLLEPITVSVAALEGSLLRDTRDFVLDARRGSFLSLNLEYSPEAIGSELRFVKTFGQAFFYKPFGPAWLWGQAYRLGLAWPFAGQELIPDERFTAGGANSVRGYPTDSLGPRDIFGDPAGGEATFVTNQELRYRHPSGLGGVLFWDAGNVFESVSALGLSLKHSLGLGLRWSSPIGPLRFDLARPLKPEPGAKRWGYYFSLGQVF